MPTDLPDSPTPAAHTLSPEQRERRARAWARSNTALHLLVGGVSVFTLAATLFLSSLSADAFERIKSFAFGFLILYATLILGLMTRLVRNRPNYLTTLRSVRVVMIGGFALLCATIGLMLVLLLWSLGVGVSTDIVMFAAIGFFVLVIAFVITSIIAAFVALIELGSRQQEEYRATHPGPS
jgi:uncharacterized membrane protein YcjF (UPF0283 family)